MTGQHSDANFQVLRSLSQQFGTTIPEFVKAADLDRDKPADTAPLSVFADPSRRQFPIHTKSATFISALYIAGQTAGGQAWDSKFPADMAWDRIEKAASTHGILPDVQRMRQGMLEKSAAAERRLTDDDFALVIKYGNRNIRRFPCVNPAMLEKSAERLQLDGDKYPYAWRKQAAVKLLHRASKLDFLLPDTLLNATIKTAGMYPKDAQETAVAVRERSVMLSNPDEKDRLVKLAEFLATGPKIDAEEVCALLDQLDHTTKLASFYGQGMPKPEEIFFDGLRVKSAAADQTVQLTTGTVYDLGAIKSAGMEPLEVLDKDLLSSITTDGQLDMDKAADILPTLPRDTAAVLDVALSTVGVRQLEKSAEYKTDLEPTMQFVVGEDGKLEVAGYRQTYKVNHKQAAATKNIHVKAIGDVTHAGAMAPIKLKKPKPASIPNDEDTSVPAAGGLVGSGTESDRAAVI